MAGRAEHRNQYELKQMYEHKLQRTAYNFCYGPFGSVQGECSQIAKKYFFLSVLGSVQFIFSQSSNNLSVLLIICSSPNKVKQVGQ